MTTTLGMEVGAPAPEFSLTGSNGEIRLSQFRGESAVILFFMRDFGCHVCVGHVLQLAKAYPTLQGRGIQVLVIGGGTVSAASGLASKYKLPFPVLADTDHAVYDRFGLDKVLLYWQKSGSFAIDKNGAVAYINSSTGPGGSLDLEELLKAI